MTRHLVDRETARIVAIGDERAFADALIELLVEPGFARKIGAAGRQIARSIFDPESLTAGVEQAYTAAMATSPVH